MGRSNGVTDERSIAEREVAREVTRPGVHTMDACLVAALLWKSAHQSSSLLQTHVANPRYSSSQLEVSPAVQKRDSVELRQALTDR